MLAEAVESDPRPPTPLALPDRLPERLPERSDSVGPADDDAPYRRGAAARAAEANDDDSLGGSSSNSGIGVLPARDTQASRVSDCPAGGLPRVVPWDVWQRLMRLEMDLAESLKAAAEPG